MQRYLRIINLDGTEGCGKSTQINLLSAYFTRMKIPYKVNRLEDNLESGIEVAKNTAEQLKDSEYLVIINDGSPARMMVEELVRGVTPIEIMDKYKELMFLNEQLNHRYGTANLLLVMDDLVEAERRIKKRCELEGKELRDFNQHFENDVVVGMRFFDTHSISKGLKFDVIDIHTNSSMMQVSEDILEYLQENFEIKKPCLGEDANQAGGN